MYRKLLLVLAPILLLSGMVFAGTTESLIQRGKYLVTFGGCNDCHGNPIDTLVDPMWASQFQASVFSSPPI